MKNKRIQDKTEGEMIRVKAVPNSSKKGIISQEGGVFKIGLNSPPQEGRANEELIEFLSDYLNIRKTNISIIKGINSRDKTILVRYR
ncbi:MAG: DUF167 domain-containing protein [Thermodesulfovibrionales bacterium]|nr:DUF167 domain-containing protein [Thermodesulfovibrionales bacterium]